MSIIPEISELVTSTTPLNANINKKYIRKALRGGGGVSSYKESTPKHGREHVKVIWAWLSRGHRWAPGVRNPVKSLVMGPSLLVNCYLEIKFHKKKSG